MDKAQKSPEEQTLKKVLKPIHLWAIAVGLVISGDYFGWNYGWEAAGTMGFLIAVGMVTVLYVAFVFSFTELSAMMPKAGGPFDFAMRALGPLGGFVAGIATLIEFLLAPPAIALALGSYVHFLYPEIPVMGTAIAAYLVFTFVNFLGIKESATFTLFITVLAVGELLLYLGITAPQFEADNFLRNAFPLSWSGIFASVPFAIWFYLAIEGVAMVAEEVENPRRNIPRGYLLGIGTLVFLAIGVMLATGGVGDWRRLSTIDYPLPAAISEVLGKSNQWTTVFTSLGLFGLIASFHSIILGYSREMFALSRAGYLPKFLSSVHPKFRTPHWALIVGALLGVATLLTGTTGQVITLSALGAVVMYIISMISLLVLRKKDPGAERPFVTPLYPFFPILALVLSLGALVAIIWFNPKESLIFALALALCVGMFVAFNRRKIP